MNNILLITKDVLRKDYLSCYGSRLYRTPNIDKLAEDGTIFMNYYAGATSTAMAITCMFSGLNAYELKRHYYKEVEQFDQCPTLFSMLEDRGYENHVVWSDFLMKLGWRYSKVFSPNTKVHNLVNTHFDIGKTGRKADIFPSPNEAEGLRSIQAFYDTLVEITRNSQRPVFIWMHCPHVFLGRWGYGSDTDLLDTLVGKIAAFFQGEIYLSADHGNMGGDRGIFSYGYHVYEGIANIPLITPSLDGRKIVVEPIGSTQLKNIILEKKIRPQEFVYSDTRYYAQPNRKLMIRRGDFKYIYNKRDKSEELYDLKYDPHENVNLLMSKVADINQKGAYYLLDELYYNPRMIEAKKAYLVLKKEWDRVWRNGGRVMELLLVGNDIKNGIRIFGLKDTISILLRLSKTRGKWGARAKSDLIGNT
ncbi:MAG: sulfatase-like hydrolase/transferase [Chloroflexi bacterium]|nr:sulfatase-like hydrolase/transferase [Chloroflexota bacterium]